CRVLATAGVSAASLRKSRVCTVLLLGGGAPAVSGGSAAWDRHQPGTPRPKPSRAVAPKGKPAKPKRLSRFRDWLRPTPWPPAPAGWVAQPLRPDERTAAPAGCQEGDRVQCRPADTSAR